LRQGARLLLGAGAAVAITVALGFLSRVPVSGVHETQAALRFSWRLRAEEAGECQRASAEELADLPVHMRNPDACVGPVPAHRLLVQVDGEERFNLMIEASGARHDRPLFVLRELRLAPGRHEVRVSFAPDDGGEADGRDGRGLFLDTAVDIGPGDVRLVTRDEDTGELVILRPRG
jgi:hypothetical protein